MPVTDIVVLALIVAAFVAFIGTLAWVSETESREKEQKAAHAPPFGARHA